MDGKVTPPSQRQGALERRQQVVMTVLANVCRKYSGCGPLEWARTYLCSPALGSEDYTLQWPLLTAAVFFFLLSVSIIVRSAVVTFYSKHPSAIFP